MVNTKAMNCDPSGEKKGLSVPLCENGVSRKAFHIKASVFLAKKKKKSLSLRQSLKRMVCLDCKILKMTPWLNLGTLRKKLRGAGMSNIHDTVESSLRNTLLPKYTFQLSDHHLTRTTTHNTTTHNKNGAELAISSWEHSVSLPFINLISLTAWSCLNFTLHAEWPCVLEGKTDNVTHGYNTIRSAL